MPLRAAAAVALALVLAAACGNRPKARELPEAPPGSVVLLTDQMVIRRGPIGREDNIPGVYVLVDVENKTPEDRLVSAAGSLKDVNGRVLGPLAADEVRVPGGQRRTLALVSTANLPDAVGAALELRGSPALDYPDPLPAVDVTTTTTLEGALVASGKIHNTQAGQGEANILCSFYDKDGHILARPFQRLIIPAGGDTAVTFTGPPGSARAVIYVGESLF